MIPKHLLIKFDELKVGQTLFHTKNGPVIISELNPKDEWPIRIGTEKIGYTKDGYDRHGDNIPILFLDCPFIEEERVVEVSSYEDFRNPEKRVLHQIKNGQFLCWCYTNDLGESNKAMNVHPWPFMRELQPEPIKEKIKVSKQDIAKLMGCGVEEIEIV